MRSRLSESTCAPLRTRTSPPAVNRTLLLAETVPVTSRLASAKVVSGTSEETLLIPTVTSIVPPPASSRLVAVGSTAAVVRRFPIVAVGRL